MTKKELETFIEKHPEKEISSAKIQYYMYLVPGAVDEINNITSKYREKTFEDKLHKRMIEQIEEPEELLQLMRKNLSGENKAALLKKNIQCEDKMRLLIEAKALTNKQDQFIENAASFLLLCKENVCGWILEKYQDFESEYLKSLLCLVLGFKGDKDVIPMLMQEVERFEKSYPNESYEQGPLLALKEALVRFYSN